MKIFFIAVFSLVLVNLAQAESQYNELSYNAQIDSTKRIKCLYGYAASKTGNHDAAVAIFEDCIERWNDVYSMIWLAHLYEDGSGVERDLEKSFQLIKRGAHTDDAAEYSSLAIYHYGVALYTGHGTDVDQEEGIKQLRKAVMRGITDACSFLEKYKHSCSI